MSYLNFLKASFYVFRFILIVLIRNTPVHSQNASLKRKNNSLMEPKQSCFEDVFGMYDDIVPLQNPYKHMGLGFATLLLPLNIKGF